MLYNLRRYSASGIYYGERIQTGTLRELFNWLRPVILRREERGYNVGYLRTVGGGRVIELQHDDRADVVWFEIERACNE